MPFDAPPPSRAAEAVRLADAAADALWRAAPRFDTPKADLAELLAPLAELARAVLPASHGGLGLSTEAEAAPDLSAVLRRIGGADLSAGRLFEGHVNAVKLVARFAAPQVADAFLREVAAGAWSGVWNAEAPPGLTLDDEGRLSGRKIYCSGAGFLHRPVVTARHPDGSARMLALRRGGRGRVDLSAWTPAGMRATATGTVDFSGVSAAPEEQVGGADDYYSSPGFKGGAWRFCAVHLGAMERLEGLLAAGLLARRRDGDPHQRARLGRAATAVETARLWVASAARRAEHSAVEPEAADAYVNLARGAVEQAALELLELVDRAMGLESQLVGPIERVARDLRTYLRQPFPDAALDAAAGHRLGVRGKLHP